GSSAFRGTCRVMPASAERGEFLVNQPAGPQAPFRLDHIVIAVSDLESAIADYRKLGFTVYPGGTHHGGASHNALVVFADGSYFELIAYLKPAPEVRWWKLLSSSGEGFVDFALLPQDTARDAAAARERGLE